jgi:hypothetical protein
MPAPALRVRTVTPQAAGSPAAPAYLGIPGTRQNGCGGLRVTGGLRAAAGHHGLARQRPGPARDVCC